MILRSGFMLEAGEVVATRSGVSVKVEVEAGTPDLVEAR